MRSARLRRQVGSSIVALGLILLTGCGGQVIRDGFAEMEGTVTMDGVPLYDAQVEIAGQNGRSYGVTDKNGRYEALYSETMKGAPIGKAIVRIRYGVVTRLSPPGTYKLNSGGEPYREETVPARYNETSELLVDIVENGSPYDFVLTSDEGM